uniref:Uncharacterized protein n=1 Tax=Rhizophora mucronata TaxID=61149 RepID=A0A2P2NBY5_RHIMU
MNTVCFCFSFESLAFSFSEVSNRYVSSS